MVCNGMYVSISVWEKHGKTCHHEPLDHSRKHWKTAPLQPPLKHLSPVDLWWRKPSAKAHAPAVMPVGNDLRWSLWYMGKSRDKCWFDGFYHGDSMGFEWETPRSGGPTGKIIYSWRFFHCHIFDYQISKPRKGWILWAKEMTIKKKSGSQLSQIKLQLIVVASK